jgi:putative transposase
MTKLTNAKIRWLIREIVVKHQPTSKAALAVKATPRRVQQLVKAYLTTGAYPVLKAARRPRAPLTPEQVALVEAYRQRYRLGARLLHMRLCRDGHRIPKNKIHTLFRERGWTTPNRRKQKPRKRCRYEREHSGSLLHGDWHRTSENHPHVIVWLDDASRRGLAGSELPAQSAAASISTLLAAIKKAKETSVEIEQVNTDRGPEFHANKGEGTSQFRTWCERHGIKHIPSRRNNPQTNGKLERFWYEYDRHRWNFPSFKAFLDWYNDRPHGAHAPWADTPNEAWLTKLPLGVKLAQLGI